MTLKILVIGLAIALGTPLVLPLRADGPMIPPSISNISPAGMQRGRTATFKIDGRSLTGAKDVIFDVPGITAKISDITVVPEKITGPRVGVDTAARVPQGKKETARMEVTVAKEVEPGIHRFRVQTPLGTSNLGVIAIGSLPEISAREKSQRVELPVTLVGTIRKPVDADHYTFEGKAGEEIVFQVVASKIGSKLQSLIALHDASGKVLAEAGEKENTPDAVLS